MLGAKAARGRGAWRQSKENRNALTDLTCVDRANQRQHEARWLPIFPSARESAVGRDAQPEREPVRIGAMPQTLGHSQIIPRHAPK